MPQEGIQTHHVAGIAGQSLRYHRSRNKKLESNLKAEAKGDGMVSSLYP